MREMHTDPERRRLGLETMGKVYGWEVGDGDGDFFGITVEHLFAEVWTRPGLTVRERRLVTLTILMCLANEMPLRLHIGAALKSGDLDDQAVDELILHVAHYGGWPVAAVASQVLRAMRSERA